MTFLFKEIKPARFKSEAFTAEILKALKQAGDEVKKDFESTTRTWRHKPEFDVLIDVSPPTLLVGTDDKIYGYVSKGTGIYGEGRGEYEIWAGVYTGRSNKKALAFPRSSTPKTVPNVIGSSAGSRSSERIVRPMVVHKGIKPRNFEETIRKKREPWFKKKMQEAMKNAARASGHGA